MSALRRTVLTVFAVFAGFAAGIFVDNFFLAQTPLSLWAKTINTDYANLLSFGASLLLVIVTIIYAGYTYRQVTYSRKQFLLDKQPYVIPSVLTRNFSDFEESETQRTRTLRLEYKIANVGTEPAFSVQPFVSFAYPENDSREELKNFGLVPYSYAYLTAGEEKQGAVSLYEKGTDEENEGLEKIYPALGCRLSETGDIVPADTAREKQYPTLTLSVYYRNLVGQWFVSTIKEDVTAVTRLSEADTKSPYPRSVTRYRLESAQTIQHLPLEIREISETEIRKIFRQHGKDGVLAGTE